MGGRPAIRYRLCRRCVGHEFAMARPPYSVTVTSSGSVPIWLKPISQRIDPQPRQCAATLVERAEGFLGRYCPTGACSSPTPPSIGRASSPRTDTCRGSRARRSGRWLAEYRVLDRHRPSSGSIAARAARLGLVGPDRGDRLEVVQVPPNIGRPAPVFGALPFIRAAYRRPKTRGCRRSCPSRRLGQQQHALCLPSDRCCGCR